MSKQLTDFALYLSSGRSFKENVARVTREEALARESQRRLAEMKASGTVGSDEITRVTRQAEGHRLEASNYRDIVLRQRSIKGFYFQPKAGYEAKEAQMRAIEAQMAILGVGP